MASGPLSPSQIAEYRERGFALVRGMFDSEEIGLLRRAAKEDKALDDHSFGRRMAKAARCAFRSGTTRAIRSTACSRAVSPW
jgi:hypothetical protein